MFLFVSQFGTQMVWLKINGKNNGLFIRVKENFPVGM